MSARKQQYKIVCMLAGNLKELGKSEPCPIAIVPVVLLLLSSLLKGELADVRRHSKSLRTITPLKTHLYCTGAVSSTRQADPSLREAAHDWAAS